MSQDFYWEFEQLYRGPEFLIKGRLQAYKPVLNHLREALPGCVMVDVGCGRGEWLTLLSENGLRGIGVDTNESMVQRCHEQGLEAHLADALTYLENCASDSLGMVTGFHIVEHIPGDKLQALFTEVFRVLRPGGVVIFETPNPENLLVSTASFYLDPTHLHPLPRQLLQFYAQWAGFSQSFILRLQEQRELYDQAPETLKNVLGAVSPDHALVAFKSDQPWVVYETLAQHEREGGLSQQIVIERFDAALQRDRTQLERLQQQVADLQASMASLTAESSDLRGLLAEVETRQMSVRDELSALAADRDASREYELKQDGRLSNIEQALSKTFGTRVRRKLKAIMGR
ncbi:SAM-dependent methyltransferase [Pseudomonas oryzihabitans]